MAVIAAEPLRITTVALHEVLANRHWGAASYSDVVDQDGRALRLLRWTREIVLPLHWRTRLAIWVLTVVVVLSLTVKALEALASLF